MRLRPMLAGIVIQAIAAKLIMIQAKPEESRKFSFCSAMIVTLVEDITVPTGSMK